MNATGRRLTQHATRGTNAFEVAATPHGSLHVIAAMSIAIVGAVLAVGVGDHEVMLIFGLGLFMAGTAIGLTFAGPVSSLGTTMQLGPDPEQVIGRHTGARI